MTETQIKIVTCNKSETFDLLELPDPNSQLIKTQCSLIKNDINLQNLVSDFTQLGELIRLAENGAVDRPQIQIQIRDIGRIITRLVGDTSLAIYAFEKTSAEVSETLKTVYEYLLSSFEDEALDTLSSVEEIAKEMLETLMKLKNDVNKACEGVKEASNAARRQRGEDVDYKKETDLKREEYSTEEKIWTNKHGDIQNESRILENQIKISGDKIEKAEKAYNRWSVADVFVPLLPLGKLAKNAKEQAENEKKERKRLIEERRRQIDARRKANEKIATFALKIQQCKDESVLLDTVVSSLQHSITSLNNIEGIMETARIFWEKIHLHCKQLSAEKFRQRIERGMGRYEESKRLELYHSRSFKCEAVKLYAEWVSVRETCLGYENKLDNCHHDFVQYLKESPNHDQSRMIVEDLAIKLKERIENNNRILMIEESKMNEQAANLENDARANMRLIADDAQQTDL